MSLIIHSLFISNYSDEDNYINVYIDKYNYYRLIYIYKGINKIDMTISKNGYMFNDTFLCITNYNHIDFSYINFSYSHPNFVKKIIRINNTICIREYLSKYYIGHYLYNIYSIYKYLFSLYPVGKIYTFNCNYIQIKKFNCMRYYKNIIYIAGGIYIMPPASI